MGTFSIGQINRVTMPTKSILVVEDALDAQVKIAMALCAILEPCGEVTVNFCSSAIDAACILSGTALPPSLIILDHDLQYGNGSELLAFMKERGMDIPVMTASGIGGNNVRMMDLGATYHTDKQSIIDGAMNEQILEALNGR